MSFYVKNAVYGCEAWAFGRGRHTQFFAVGFLIPNAPERRKAGGQKKLKPFAKGFVFFFALIFRELNYELI